MLLRGAREVSDSGLVSKIEICFLIYIVFNHVFSVNSNDCIVIH